MSVTAHERWVATRKPNSTCEQCEDPMYRAPSQAARGHGRFCTLACANEAKKKFATDGEREAHRKEYRRRWYEEHREDQQEAARAWYHANRDRVIVRQRERRGTDPEFVEADRARSRAYYKEHKEEQRARAFEKRYGITWARREELIEQQGGVCAGCLEPEGKERHLLFSVDHDHSCCPGPRSCGRCIRGILHSHCNRVAGMVGDDPERLEHLARYLRAR